MKKLFMDRIEYPNNTIIKQKEYIDTMFKYNLDVVSDQNKMFFTSQIIIKNINKELSYYLTSGKGLSKDECLASNYGELIERYAWQLFLNKIWENENFKVESLNLKTNNIDIFDSKNILKYEGRSDYIASGNDFFEAIYHVLTEAYEYGLLKNNYPYSPVEYSILTTEDIYPTFPQYIHDNYTILLRKDPRIPLYDITAFKAPTDKDTKFMPINIISNNNNVKLIDVVNHFSSSVGDRNDEEPWPSFSGSRAGLNLEKTIKLAIAEQVQEHYLLKLNNYIDYDIKFNKKNIKRQNDSIFNINNANDLPNYETSSIEEDVDLIVKAFNKIGFNIWVIDITPNNCPMKVVKIITDYSIGNDNPHSKRVLNNFFNIGENI
jgi:hypothetical protein